MKRLYLTIFYLMISMMVPYTLWSAPLITSVSGSIGNGQTITISGSGFGSHPKYSTSAHTYLNRFWDNFESGSLNTATGYWDRDPTSVKDAQIVNNKNRTGSTYSLRQGNYKGGVGLTGDTTQAITYLYCWRWFDDLVEPGTYSNWKIYRIWGNGVDVNQTNWDAVIKYDGWSDGSINVALTVQQTNQGPGTHWGLFGTGYRKSWHLYEAVIDKNAGTFQMWYDGVLKTTDTYSNWTNYVPGGIYFDSYYDGANPSTCSVWTDDCYVDHTRARVMIGNASTFSSSTHREILIPVSWNGTSVSVQVNQGSFLQGDSAYLYVVDQDGAVNAAGYAITIGQGSSGGSVDTTPPASPSGVSVIVIQ